jgi:hypothetical protein
MKNPRLLLVSTIAMAIVLLAFLSAPPDGNTGAPGENLCSDCHGGSNPLGLDGDIEISGPGPNVLAGETYQVSVLVTNPNALAQRAGFQIVALDENDDNIGTLSNPSANSTISTFLDRTYFKHNPAVDFPASNEVEWTVDWTAPTNPTSTTVNFYGAGNIADGNNLNTNDYIVTTHFTVDIDLPTQPLELEIVSSTDVSCFGGFDGTAEAEASGGTGSGYSFLWSNGETGSIAVELSAGLQSVTVTDGAGSTAETSVFISEPDLTEIGLMQLSHVSCEGGTDGFIAVEVTGGIPPYNFSWSDGSVNQEISGLSAGEYQLTVTDDNGCTASSSFTILDGNPIEVVQLVDDVSCAGGNDGSVVLIPSGDNPPFSAVWSNGETGLELSGFSAGLYSVTITDNAGCETVELVEIEEAAPLEANPSVTDVNCNTGNDGSIELSPAGDHPPYEAVWSDGFEGLNNTMLTAGTYEFTLTDAQGCEISGSEEIFEPEALQINLSAIHPSCPDCNDGFISAVASGGVGGYSFVWDSDPVQTGSFAENLVPAEYSVTVTDDNNCTATASYNLFAEGSCDSIISYFYNHTDIYCDAGNIESYCFDMGPPIGDTLAWPGCDGELILNPQWLTFVAGSDSLDFTLEISECTNGSGVQIALYELPPDIDYNPNEPGLTPEADWLAGDCSMVSVPQSGLVSFGLGTSPGNTYGLVFSGSDGDQCQIEFLQVEGAENAPDLTNTQTAPPVFDNTGFESGIEDTICQGAQGLQFTLDPGVEGASFYLWTVNGQEIATGDNSLSAQIDFPDVGTFEVCVVAANSCSSGEPGCVEVQVHPLPSHVLFDTICSREFYFWKTPFGPVGDTLGPFDTEGDFVFDETVSSAQGCILETQLFLHVIEDNFDSPTEFFEVICWDDPDPVYVPFEGHPQAQSFDMTGIYGLDRDLFINQEGSPGSQFECDSFFILELLALEALVGPLDFECTDSELIVHPGTSLVLPGLEAYSDDIVVRYEWKRSADSSLLRSELYSDSLDLVLRFPLEDLTGEVETFTLHLYSRYSDDPDSTECENIYSIDINTEDLIPLELTIGGPDTLLAGQEYTFIAEELSGTADEFSWSFDPEPEEFEIDLSTRSVNLVYSELGLVELCVTASNYCGARDTTCIEIVVDTDVSTPFYPSEELNLKVYPNPFEQILQLQSDTEIGRATWEIYNSAGSLVLSGEGVYEEIITVSTGSLTSGMYFLKLTRNEEEFMFKVVRQ